jgi:dGTPase
MILNTYCPEQKAMNLREEIEKAESEKLVSYACLASRSLGKTHSEEKSTNRTDFQRDRDRILHSTAFRRMEYKTQVFVNHEGDHYRTRLTHTLEVSQIARTVARILKINEDLTEALVLSHDIGHTPFGHAGERVMKDLMKEYGGFEHNRQSLRIVEKLEHPYPHFEGLNLSFEIREGITKHSAHWKKENVPAELKPNEQPTLEAQMIDYVDEIAYNNHDVDDGLESQMFSFDDLAQVTLWKDSVEHVRKKFSKEPIEVLKRLVISSMITTLVDDLVKNTLLNIKDHKIESLAQIRSLGKTLAGYSEPMREKSLELKSFLRTYLYDHPRVIRMEEKAKRILQDLFRAYQTRPEQLPRDFIARNKGQTKERMICDYIAGMTDRFAVEEHKKLFDPTVKV